VTTVFEHSNSLRETPLEVPDPQWVLANSDCVATADEVQAGIAAVAEAINRDFAGQILRVAPLLNGALPFAGMVLPQLTMPVRVTALQVGRYGLHTRGQDLEWLSPVPDVRDETVLLLDDVLDEGITLTLVRSALLAAGASRVISAVLVEKNPLRSKPIQADYVALTLPDRFLFGMGMDAFGWWRNLPAIHAVREGDH